MALSIVGDEVQIQIPLSAPVTYNDTGPLFTGGQYGNVCQLLIRVPSPDYSNTFATQLWQYAYTVFDLANNRISIATPNIRRNVAIPMPIPAGGVTQLSGDITGLNPIEPPSNYSPSDISSIVNLKISVGVALPGVALLSLLAYIFCRCRKARKAKTGEIYADATASSSETSKVQKPELNGEASTMAIGHCLIPREMQGFCDRSEMEGDVQQLPELDGAAPAELETIRPGVPKEHVGSCAEATTLIENHNYEMAG